MASGNAIVTDLLHEGQERYSFCLIGLALHGLFENNLAAKEIAHGTVHRACSSAVVFEVIRQKNVKCYIAKLRPGMYGQMRLGKANYGRIPATRKIMIHVAYFGQTEKADLIIDKAAERGVIAKQGIFGKAEIGQYMQAGNG